MQNQRDEIARRIRALREDNGLSVAALARRCGIDRADCAAYERGVIDVPLSRMTQLANGLGVDESVLLTGADAHVRRFYVTRRRRGPVIERRAQYHYEALGVGFAGKSMDPFVVTVNPSMGETSSNTHPGQELNYLLRGRLEVRIDESRIELAPGDSLYFDARRPHAMRALDNKPATFLAVMTA